MTEIVTSIIFSQVLLLGIIFWIVLDIRSEIKSLKEIINKQNQKKS